MAEISVADTGKGIPLELQEKIFQLFFTTRPGGSGIGLATTFRIVQLHNGSIDFQSEAGRGTTFRIELPLAPAYRSPYFAHSAAKLAGAGPFRPLPLLLSPCFFQPAPIAAP